MSTIARRRLNGKAAADRGWDAIVTGEHERAFYGNQHASMAPLLEYYGIQLWLRRQAAPSAGSEDDEQLMLVLGLQSKQEITRIRVRTAMAAGRTSTPQRARRLSCRRSVCDVRGVE